MIYKKEKERKKERKKEIALENIRNHLFLPFSKQRNRSRYIVIQGIIKKESLYKVSATKLC
jgi:hypothetical protein